jgi:hypothetical protein
MWGNAINVFLNGLIKGNMIKKAEAFLSSGTKDKEE